VKVDALPSYNIGDTVNVTFYTGNPRNDYRDEDTFLTVERSVGPLRRLFLYPCIHSYSFDTQVDNGK